MESCEVVDSDYIFQKVRAGQCIHYFLDQQQSQVIDVEDFEEESIESRRDKELMIEETPKNDLTNKIHSCWQISDAIESRFNTQRFKQR